MENKKLLTVYAYAKNIWSSFKLPDNEQDIIMMNKVWGDYLEDYDIDIILMAIRKHSAKSDFCSIAKIEQECDLLYRQINNLILDEEIILKEIKKAISYTDCKENFKGLSDFAKKIVVHPAYLAQWAMEENKGVRESLLRKEIAKTIVRIENERFIEKNKKLLIGNDFKLLGKK